MALRTITLQLPENLYIRLHQASQATKQSFDEIVLHAVRTGSPPGWDDVPAEFQADIAALDRLDDNDLWRVARWKSADAETDLFQRLLDKKSEGTISHRESEKLKKLRTESDRNMLCKAHAAALLRWRGHNIPPSEKL